MSTLQRQIPQTLHLKPETVGFSVSGFRAWGFENLDSGTGGSDLTLLQIGFTFVVQQILNSQPLNPEPTLDGSLRTGFRVEGLGFKVEARKLEHH